MLIFKSSLLLILVVNSLARNLDFVQTIFRHGTRYPIYPNNQDYSNISTTDTAEQLSVEGRQMMFILGRAFFQEYWGKVVNKTEMTDYYYELIQAKSTRKNRTIQSLEQFLLGFTIQSEKNQTHSNTIAYPAFKKNLSQITHDTYFNQWKENRLIPIIVQKTESNQHLQRQAFQGDTLSLFMSQSCPKQALLYKDNVNSQRYNDDTVKNSKVLQVLSLINAQYHNISYQFNNVSRAVDSYFCLKAMEVPYLPVFDNPDIQKYLNFFYAADLFLDSAFTTPQIKMVTTLYFEELIRNMKRSIDTQKPKFVFHAGHDTNLISILSALNLTSYQCVRDKYLFNKENPYCLDNFIHFSSNLIFELYQQKDLTHSIELKVDGVPYSMPICGLKKSCPLDDFEDWFSEFKVDVKRQCSIQVVKIFKNKDLFFFMFLSFFFGVMAVIIFIVVHNKMKNKDGDTFSDKLDQII